MSSANSDRFTSLPTWILFIYFLYLGWLLWLGLLILCWVEVVRVSISVLFLDLTGRLSAFPHWVLYWPCVYHKWFLLCWDIFPLHLPWGEVFIMNGCWILSNAFSVAIKMIMWSLFFLLIMWCIHWFACVEPLLWLCSEPGLIMVYNPFHVSLDSVC